MNLYNYLMVCLKVNEIINKAALKTIQRALKNDSMHTPVEIGRPSLSMFLVPGHMAALRYNWKIHLKLSLDVVFLKRLTDAFRTAQKLELS